MTSELVRRKPREFQVMNRIWIEDEPYVELLSEGSLKAINVRWDDFKADYEPSDTPPAHERSRVGQWVLGRYLGRLSGIFLCRVDNVGASRFISALALRPHASGGYAEEVVAVEREAWDSAVAEWIDHGRPES